MNIPLSWKLAVMVSGVVVVVSIAMVMAWAGAHAGHDFEHLGDESAMIFVRLALLNAVFWTVVAGVLSAVYVRRITLPLSRIAAAAAQVEAGNFDVRVPVPEGDEMGTFTAQFNNLVASLRNQRSEIDRLVEDLNRANASLAGDVRRSERLAALGTLSAGLAHELNNLLNSIAGYTSVMQVELGEQHELADDLTIVRRECQRASELISRFLMFARPAALKPRPGSVEEILESCLSVLALPMQKQDVRLVRELENELPVIVCDSVMLEQALFNVMHNAVQAMKRGGTLTVTARRVPTERIAICVEDTGPGIPEEFLTKVFDPFFTTKGPGEGTGLGLAIAHRILEQHDGTIHIASSAGAGTRVVMELPIQGRLNEVVAL
ncbi:MAG: HAMP domain-containing protein [Candidatus Wallbacteria bacterium]|nr:HAMP domain-containing protein [Candidatus Wallbacteria bacterium]